MNQKKDPDFYVSYQHGEWQIRPGYEGDPSDPSYQWQPVSFSNSPNDRELDVAAPAKEWLAKLEDMVCNMRTSGHEVNQIMALAQQRVQPLPAEPLNAQIAAYELPDGARAERVSQVGGGHLWAVRKEGQCMSRTGDWDYEPSPSNRTADWILSHRFPTAHAAIKAHERYCEEPGPGETPARMRP